MQPLQCGSQHQLANLHLSTHITTPEHQMTTVMQPFECDLQAQIPKHPITTHTQAHRKQLEATVTLRQKKRQTDRSRTRRTHEVPFIVACSHFTRKNARFRAPASSPNHSPCNIMQPLQCGSQHQLANLHLSTHRTTPEHQMRTVMQPFQCDLQAQIPKHPITTHTQAQLKQLEATVTLRQKKRQTDRSRTRRTHEVAFIAACSHFTRKTQGFVLRLPPQTIAHATFMQPWLTMKQPFHYNLQPEIQEPHRTTHTGTTTRCKTQSQFFTHVLSCSVKSHTTLHQSQFFTHVLLCSVKSHTTLHQSQFFTHVLLCSVKSHTTLHQGQFFSDVLLCSVKSHTTLHQGQFFSDVWLCSVKSHTTLHQSQFFSAVLSCNAKAHTTLHQGQVSLAHYPSSLCIVM